MPRTDRRDFLRILGLGGLALCAPSTFLTPRRARALTASPYDGPLWLMVQASGGWDPTSLCDPKGRVDEEELDPMNMYFVDEIGTAGNIQYAPVPGHKEFFDKHHAKTLVLNGVDTATNGHESGRRNTWSGTLGEGFPSLPALVAAVHAPTQPMAFISNGGYDHTAGLVAPTRVGNTNLLDKLAHTNRLDPDDPEQTYHSLTAAERISQARMDRLDRLIDSNRLPRFQHALGTLYNVRSGDSELTALSEHLPDVLDNSNNALKRQAQLAIAAYKAGLTVGANLSMGGFDTHGNHDASHFPRMQTLLEGIDFLWEEAERQDVADRLVVVVGSDFGRTPGYNPGGGKDHWSITSMMLMGAGIPGNTVIGSTDGRHRAYDLDATSLTSLGTTKGEQGLRITPEHVHKELRALAGVSGTEIEQRFPFAADTLGLLG